MSPDRSRRPPARERTRQEAQARHGRREAREPGHRGKGAGRGEGQEEHDKVLQLAPDELLVEVLERDVARGVGRVVHGAQPHQRLGQRQVSAVHEEGDLRTRHAWWASPCFAAQVTVRGSVAPEKQVAAWLKRTQP